MRLALLVVLLAGCEKLTAREICALNGQRYTGTSDIHEQGETSVRCEDPRPGTYIEDSCWIAADRRYAKRGLVINGYRLFEGAAQEERARTKAVERAGDCEARIAR